MSRSTRKTPIFGITTAESEKEFKRKENRKFRRQVRQRLSTLEFDDELPNRKKFGDPWLGDKDGKTYYVPNDSEEMDRYMRK